MGLDMKRWVVPITLVLTVCTAITLVLTLLATNTTLPPGTKFGLVFDAGSSHTSLFVYQWPGDKENDTGVVSQTMACDVQGDGISSYARNPEAAGRSLRPCLDEAVKLIPAPQLAQTPVYLGATAGMRILSLQDPKAADGVLAEVGKTIQEYPMDFRGARIISGAEEGAYGWITINYLLDTFTKYSVKNGGWIRPPASTVLGALDLGGASTQISFLPSGSIADPATASHFRLYGFNYTIYTHSYLCYGQAQAQKQVIQKLSQESQATPGQVEHPCYHKGFKNKVMARSIYDSPCTAHLQPRGFNLNQEMALVGTGNVTKCQQAIRAIFNFTACGLHHPCAFNGTYQPDASGQFFAFSAFFYTFNFLNITSGQSLLEVMDTIKQYCSRSWTNVTESYPKHNLHWLQDYCANANYILVLLLEGYKFSDKSWTSIRFQQKASGTDIGWTLGYMLNLTNIVPVEAPVHVRTQKEGPWVTSIIFLVLTLVTALVLLLAYFF
ncbi:ectonucleoside triphosphate diphosphohydrolase 8-like isoform X1 [Vombatus ursinus]|uniref:Ectonucleoside triphosphate diphosphohydrolase 8 n=1 Tax=Vombatus ursinus TaxID=29139 RepID=A0A4X2KFZ7_VOMUR|nr:ectonucleoside triphosphate diphosphohydrolase 8-like isoform X1 [Vombatus ursinus]XP_027705272.1 ectonucleoside triphosphate diphosphohydrolase 8-like isoform X1 [Vombatus ursinus]XP_027705276.1 ectonucleoside triphosphate diphosphohydrolase 8-like isoform X1 [Vombatus ursinus]XP_027705281.1 ectonucleoside triphosphate diphosphohydrolase 8-like isoform X1 [Vombatus ursinus]XP_027705290.1 ectonucleoside triphosphate diphosphohydrolase 8-like isoform X1 [Vombatus ursinus]